MDTLLGRAERDLISETAMAWQAKHLQTNLWRVPVWTTARASQANTCNAEAARSSCSRNAGAANAIRLRARSARLRPSSMAVPYSVTTEWTCARGQDWHHARDLPIDRRERIRQTPRTSLGHYAPSRGAPESAACAEPGRPHA
jgi:hypothetical protein